MPDLPPSTDSNGNDADLGTGRGSTDKTPRWVYVFGIIAVVLVLVFVIAHIAGGGLGHH